MEEPKTLCDTCRDRENCDSNSRELITLDDLDALAKMEVKAKAVVYRCNDYQWFDWGVRLNSFTKEEQM